MSMNDLRVMLEDRLRDTVPIILQWQRDAAIAEALKRYSLDYPAPISVLITGDGTATSFPLAAPFAPGFSTVECVEYPLAQQTPVYLDPDDYGVYYAPPSTPGAPAPMLRFYSLVLGPGAQAGVTYTGYHSVSETVDTVPPGQQEWVAWLAAAICYRELAAYYAQTSESTLGADAAFFRERTTLYLNLAKQAEEIYRNQGMMTEESVRAANVSEDMDVELSIGRLPRFFHSNRYR